MNDTIKKYELKKLDTDFKRVKIHSSEEAQAFIRQFYSDDIGIFESFFLLLMDQSNSTIGYVKISQGGIAGTVVDPILVAKYSIDSLAKAVILAHNHPSGNRSASTQDRAITERIKKGLALFDIQVFDHIILTEDGYSSFADLGFL
jgi:DNA repair protein RadC